MFGHTAFSAGNSMTTARQYLTKVNNLLYYVHEIDLTKELEGILINLFIIVGIGTKIALEDFLKRGERLSQPRQCSDQIHQLLKMCWSYNPQSRLGFEEVLQYFD